MPFWIQGWIEVCSHEDTTDEYAWMSVLNLGSLDLGGEFSEYMFGLSKRYVSEDERAYKAVAANRDLPSNPSKCVREEMIEIKEHELKYGSGEIGGYTYAYWAEIKSTLSLAKDIDHSEWNVVFSLVDCLQKYRGYADDKIRLIVWWNW
ncbi:MAG: hypothetical protein SFY80_15820 [Verrucomicrobiota bacterium]|nr:hypothetical protein [Verrucomicrobiota bacterium]